MARVFNWRALKEHRVYSIEEASALLRCAPRTLKRLLYEEGVQVIDDLSPMLVIGADLIPALRGRNTKGKLAPGQMFCLGCKKPAYPDGGVVDDVAKPNQPSLLQALCSNCGAVMSRRVARGEVAAFLKAAQNPQSNVS
ncbi:hypothetical protein AVO45_13455 [Ruegeria marisrubri]|uniref:Uncharacterized protein n=1 Tax=Ruegeria marisrubri TaxID=1685379 RepID=A0A0X3TMP7_9RHOB|nr:hypothetical protein [Ruegeria marisrubri]KUJ76301.1 hypothetical protein AVO45_13455 [Ruegeria marisrubri]